MIGKSATNRATRGEDWVEAFKWLLVAARQGH